MNVNNSNYISGSNSVNNSNSEDNDPTVLKIFGAVLLVIGFLSTLFLLVYTIEDLFKWNIWNILVLMIFIMMTLGGIALLILSNI